MPVWITEYAALGSDAGGQLVQLPVEPALVTHSVATGGTSAQSAVLNEATRFVRIVSDVNAYIAFDTNPTASTATTPIFTGVPEFRAIRRTGLKIAAIAA